MNEIPRRLWFYRAILPVTNVESDKTHHAVSVAKWKVRMQAEEVAG